MKTLWKICKSIFMLLLTGVIVWTILYFTVPKVKDWTNDKVFKIDQSKDDEEKKQLRAENEDLKNQIKSLTTEATTVSAELTNVKDQLSAKTTALETATSEKQELENKVSELEQKVSELESSETATKAELETKKQELSTARNSLQEKTAEVETLTSEKQTLETQKSALETQLAEKQNQIQTLQARVAGLEEELYPGDDYNYTVEELENWGYLIENIEGTQKFVHVSKGNSESNLPLSGLYSIKNNKCKKLLHEDSYSKYYYYKTNETTELILGEKKSLTITNNILTEHDFCLSDANGVYRNSVIIIDEKNIAVFKAYGWVKINIETEEETAITKDDNCSASTTNTLFDWKKISSNKYYGRYNQTYVIYNTETNIVTQSEFMNFHAPLSNNKYIVGDNSKYYIFDTTTEEKTEINSTQSLFLFEYTINPNSYKEWENGDVVLMGNYGPVLYSKSNNTIELMDTNKKTFRGILLNTASGKVFATCFCTNTYYQKGIYIINVDSNGYPVSATKIYSQGQYWDTVVEDENGCTFSSKYDPSQGSVYYNYSTGECTAVTE